MRFKGLDLNLLVALDVLLEERSVSRAAARLNLSQPATSAALARLREFFGDDILVLHGKRMFATPYADSLRQHVRACLKEADALIATSTLFDPAVSARTFRIVTSDYISVAVLAPLVRALETEAPEIRFEFLLPDDAAMRLLDRGAADLVISPEQFVGDDHVSEPLFDERHVVVGCRDHPIFDRPVTEAEMFACRHVAVAIGARGTTSFGDRQLELLGKPRRIDVVASSFTMVPWLLIGTRRLAVMHERLARAMAATFPIRLAALPFAFPMMAEVIEYHPSRAGDEGLRWLCRRLRAHLDRSPIHATDSLRSEQ